MTAGCELVIVKYMYKGSKTEEMFETILRGIDISITTFTNPRGLRYYGYDKLIKVDEAKKLAEQKRAISNLQKQEFIKVKKQGDKIFFELTEKGKTEALKRAILNIEKNLPKHQICIVSFDIPESVRHVRHALRILLKEAGFKLRHHSVWEGRRDIVNELVIFVRKMKAEKWITIYVGERKTK